MLYARSTDEDIDPAVGRRRLDRSRFGNKSYYSLTRLSPRAKGRANGKFLGMAENDRARTPVEIAARLAAMEKVELFDTTNNERIAADAWQKQVFTIPLTSWS